MTFDSLHSFVSNLKNHKILFNEPLFAISLLRLLDKETSNLIFELLRTNLHISTIKTLPNAKELINNLLSLSLIQKSGENVLLDPNFRNSLLLSFSGLDLNRKFKSEDFLEESKSFENIADAKFKFILEAIVSRIKIDHLFGVKEILFFSKLIDEEGVTNKGFEFLLKNKKAQLWFLALNAISYFSKDNLHESSLLLDLLELVMKKNQSQVRVEKWEPFYSFLDSIGIIILVNRKIINVNKSIKENYKDVTQFIVNNADLFDQNLNIHNEKFIIFETNFKIYAYTSKSYEKSVLSLFSKTVSTLPNLVKAVFDEDSIVSAFNKGITGQQIIKYLQDYCDDVPKNIINQICIWEQKQHRIRIRNGYLYHDFIHLSDFNKISRFLESKGSLIYKDEQRRVVIGEERTHDELKEFFGGFNR